MRKKAFSRKIIATSCLAGMFTLGRLPVATAADYTVGGAGADYATLEELRLANPNWDAGANTITLRADDSSLTAPLNTGGKPVTIRSDNGHYFLSPSGQARFLDTGAGSVVIDGSVGSLSLKGYQAVESTAGKTAFGGAIFAQSDLTISATSADIEFIGNKALAKDTFTGAVGGAIVLDYDDATPTATITADNGNILFSGNAADASQGYWSHGGAIGDNPDDPNDHANGVLLLAAQNGGSITFTGNYAVAAPQTAYPSWQSNALGGAIAVDNLSIAAATGSSILFAGNYAADTENHEGNPPGSGASGGAIFLNGSTKHGKIALTGEGLITFRGNYAKASGDNSANGGAIFEDYGNSVSDDFQINIGNGGKLVFADNYAEADNDFGNYYANATAGGAIYAYSPVELTTTGTGAAEFTGNYAKNTNPNGAAYGGAIFTHGGLDITGGNISFANNSGVTTKFVAYGGAIYAADHIAIDASGTVEFKGNSVSATTGAAYGGAISGRYETPSDIVISTSGSGSIIFAGNSAIATQYQNAPTDGHGGFGGAVYNGNYRNATGSIAFTGDNISFIGNRASSMGGAIYGNEINIAGNNITFTGNSAGYFGGAIGANEINIAGNKITFANNSAGSSSGYGRGGALYSTNILSIVGGNILFDGNKVDGATASTIGGAISFSGVATIQATGGDITFKNNQNFGSGGRAEAIFATVAATSLDLKADVGYNINFYDGIFNSIANGAVGTLNVNINDGYTPDPSATYAGTVLFDGNKSRIHGDTTVYAGTIKLANGASYVDEYDDGDGAIGSTFTLKEDAEILLVGAGNKIAADKIVFEYESTIAVDLASLPTGNTAAAIILEGTLFLQDGYGSMINLLFLNPVGENGTYLIIDNDQGYQFDVGSYADGDADFEFYDPDYYSMIVPNSRYGVATLDGSEAGKVKLVITDADVARDATWQGNDANWQEDTDNNWSLSGDLTGVTDDNSFKRGDNVIFGSEGSGNVSVTVQDTGVTVGTMTVVDAGYSFSGGKISGEAFILTDNATSVTIDADLSFRDVNLDGGLVADIAGDRLLDAQNITGSGGINKEGTGTLFLRGDNDFAGNVEVTGGLLNFAAASNLGAGAVILDDGGLQWASGNNADVSSRLTLESGGGVLDTLANEVTLAGAIDGSGGLTKRGEGTLTLTGENTYTGATLVAEGLLNLSGGATLAKVAGDVTVSSHFAINKGLIDGKLTLNSGSVFDVRGIGNAVTGELSDPGALIRFFVPGDYVPGDIMLHIGGGATLDDATVLVGIEGASALLKKNEAVILMEAEDEITKPESAASGYGIMPGLILDYEFEIERDENAQGTPNRRLVATVTRADASASSKALSEGKISGLSFLNQGADLLAGEGMKDAARQAAAGTGGGAAMFAAMGYSDYRAKTGSHVDVKGPSLVLGLAKGKDVRNGRLTLGGFVETGWGDYETYNDGAEGDGDTSYWGVGALGRMDYSGGFYLEGSIKAGRVKNDFYAPALGNARYQSSSTYYGAHLGIGRLKKLGEESRLDLYSKLFYTRQNGDTALVSGITHAAFDGAHSFRWRGGLRYIKDVSPKASFYVGAGYDYEFSGNQGANANGYGLAAPSLKGGTAIGEIGLTYKKSKEGPFSADFKLEGFTGKKRGFGGAVELKWTF